jgi:IS5 family transposase
VRRSPVCTQAVCSVLLTKGYDKKVLRETLCDLNSRRLAKHRIFAAYDHAHNARIDNNRDNQRFIEEPVKSAMKRLLGFVVQARS